ncbi:hypothetical protein [Phenylobacterium sp.]|uniref:hypothetical protein n=1 Tax=Phenylobacterium sp. TaxID=1871053 RepID=UPI0035B22FA3
MFHQELFSVFSNAALPQKIVLIALISVIPLIILSTALIFRANNSNSVSLYRLVSTLGLAGPGVGLLTGAMNSFHMAETIQRLPAAPTLKQIAPGIFEVAALVGLGALVGLIATVACLVAAARRNA